jgi:hypothetical protein
MSGYSRDFLIDAFMSRYIKCTLISIESLVHLEQMANDLYDRVGRDSFRVYASLDADAIRVYKNSVD